MDYEISIQNSTYPVSGMSPHRYGNPGVLSDWSLVSHCRSRPLLHLGEFAEHVVGGKGGGGNQ